MANSAIIDSNNNKHDEDLWSTLGNIFTSLDSNTYTKSQWFDVYKAKGLHICSEYRLWIEALCYYIDTWNAYLTNPTRKNWLLVKDLEEWANDVSINNISLHCVTDAVYMVFGVEEDIFIAALQKYFLMTKPKPVTAVAIFDIGFEPFSSYDNIGQLSD